MNDFEFFSKAQDDEEENNQNAATPQGGEETPAPREAASDFDFFSSIERQEKPKEEYGALDSQRDKLQAELGDDPDVQTRAGAAFVNMMPFAATLSKENRDIRLKGLEALRSKSKMKEIDEMRKRNEKPVVPHKRSKSSFMKFLEYGAMAAGARNGMPMMPMPDGEAAPVFSGDTRARLKAHDAEVKKRMEGSAEDAYFAQLRDFAIKEAELKEAEVDKLRKESKTVDEFADKLSVAATDALTRFATAKKNAAKRLEKADLPWYKEAASGFMSNAGYTGQFIAASGLPYAGLGFLAAAGASQRFGELTTKEYDVDDDGRLVVLHNEDNGGAGTVAKAVAGGAAEVAVEQYLEKGLGLLFNGVRRIPGVGTAIGKAGDSIAGAVGKATGAIGAKMSRNAAGKWVVGAAKGFGKYSEITGVQGMPTEMLEEHVQSFADDVLGFDKKSRDQKGFGAEASDWWKNKFWNKKSNREIFLGLIGTMAVQGTYAGVKAHHDIAKWRQNPAGYLKTMIDEKTVDSLSDDEVAHLFKFVSSPRFTKENVERFLGHVKDRVEMSNALLQLKEANAPFFETDGGALDEAISSGAIKSQYVPPTRSVMEGARQLDWQPYTMKDGRRTMRLYDPNTGIAIDAIGGDKNNVVVTNRDGQRFDVGSMENAMNVADRLSVSNQLLDAKRPMKDAYVRKRIQEVFPGGDFVILKNAAEMNKMFPDISKDRDYDPTNPAFTKDGKVYLVLDNMRNAYEVNRMILHEAAIHTGLNKKFTTDEKRDFLRNISDPETVKLMRKLGAIRGKESIDDLSDADVEEAFAHVWDRRRANPLFTQKVTHALREMGRSVGLPIDYNTDDLEVMVDTLQREGRRGSGSVSPSSDFDTASHTDSVPYNEAQRDYSGDVVDIGKPSEETDDMAAIRQMQRIDRIKQNHPRMWSYAMRVNDNDEDAAADFVAKALEEEGKHGVRGEAEHGMHALEVAEKLENGEDLTPDDIEILDEHGFTGPILYSDYGYRKQKNGVWKLEVIPEKPQTPKTKQEKPNETGTRTDETPVQQKQGDAGRSAAAEAARPAESQPARTEAPGVVKEPAQASASERTVIERMTDDAPVEELPVAEVANDDSRIPNFKEGADPETGEVEPLKGEPYDLVSNPIVVMEFNDGKKVVVTGRHRLALYKRSGRGKIPARVIRERDGWTVDDAKAIDAIGNIIDEKGSVKDYVKYFDSAKPSREQAERGGFLARPKGRRAFGIYEGAGENLRSLIDWEGTGGEGLISVEQAGAIAEAAPKDAHPRNDAVQKILARKALEGVRGKKLGILARALAEEVRNRKDTPKASGVQQLDLFTSEDDLALMAAEERRAGYRAKKANEYTRIAEVLRTALRKGGKLDLNKGYAKELGITNPKDKDQLATARDRAIERANYWENSVRLDDADKSEMDAALGLSQGNAKPGLTLESSTAEEIKAEEEAQRQRDAIKAGQARPLKGGSGEIGQTQLDLGDTNGDLFNPVVRNESAKPKGDFAQQITDAIDVDAKDGLIKVVPDARFGEGAHVALYAQGSESEIKAAADSLRTAFPDAKIFTDENSVVVVPASGASQGAAKPNDDTIDLSDSLGDLGAMWFNREQDEHTDEERQAHNIVLGVKIIKNFAAKGGKDFGQFARSVKAVAPEVYGRIRNQMPGMWLNAWMGGEKALVVPQADEYEGILAATDAWKAPEKPKSTPQKPQEREEAAGQDKDTPKHKTRGEAISAAADEMIDLIRVDATQRKLTRKDLENVVAKHLGGSVAEGTFEMKDVTDIMELAVNRILSGDMFAPTDKPIQKIALIRNVLNKIPTQTTRSAEQDKMQQFSTVPHEAFAAAWVANITDKDVMLEPSAGIGGIAVFAKNAGAEVILNELSPRRREILEQLGLSPKVYDFNAEHLWAQFYSPVKKGEVKRPTVVVMNPPFSNSALTSKKDTVGVGGKHIEEALEMLAPGGRLVAIVGHGMTHNADSPKVKAWWKKIGAKYRVRADVTVNGDEYAKYGTTYDNDILVIDKVAPDNTIAPIFGKIQSIDELPAMLEGVRNDRPAIQSENVAPKPDNGGPDKGTPGRGNGGNHLQPGNGGNGSDKPRGKPAGRADGRVPGAKEDGGRGHSSGTGLGVGSTVPDGAGLTEVRTAQGDSGEASPRELGDGTFSAYRPAKVRIEGAKPHPTALVESTAMASVLPPDPTYSPILPKKAIESGMPSDAQLEQIVYAGQAHEQKLPDGRRKGYFFGDGTGLGKGTEIGGVISDNWNHGRRKAVWVSKKPQLINDAMRDLVTYGLDGQIFDFNPKKKSVMGRDTGIAFLSYDGLKQDCVFDTEGKVRSAKQGQRNRFQQLVEWLGKDFDGVIVFDEAHKAGNAVPTRGSRGAKPASKQALAVVALQDALPNARILYVSATGATEVSNLSYATRLGLWGKGTAFRDRTDFINRVSAGGLSVMEIVARDMKSMGVYMARSLSYDGIVNRKLEHSLSPDQKRKYDEMADAWQMVMARVGDALVTTGGVGNGNAVSAVMSALWGGQQRFFNQLLTAMQMPSVIADAKKQLDEGNSVVFQLINTNEATQKRAIEAQRQQNGEVNADELDLSPRDILVGFVRNSFPVVKYVEQEDDEGNKEWVVLTGPDGQPVEDPIALEARQELLDKLNMMKLDDNPLELIIEEFGAENVAEITGRSQRRQMVRNDDGEMEMKLVRRSDKICFTEAGEFNDGKRRVLVFSDSGGTGFSFHADKRFGNQQKRIHYLVQAGWRADAALQGFGRTHRSNEAQPPEYVLCSTDIRGHQRFISTVARRLAQLGSLTAGDRASAGSGVFSDEDNLENQYAENAVKDLFHSIHREDFGRFNTICKQLGFVKMKLDKRTGDVNEVNDLIDPEDGTINDEKLSIQKFLNRILNCRVDVQNRLFDEFAEIMHDHIEQAKENGTFDPGLERLQGHKIEETSRTELWSGGKGTGSTDIVEIGVSNRTRKVDYETVLARMQRQAEGRNWFFARNTNSGKVFGFAETPRAKTLPSGLVVNQLRCYTPDGKAPLVLETDVRFDGDHANFEMVSEKEAAEEWGKALAAIPDMNTTKRYFVSGTLLPIWDRLAVQNPRIFRVAPTGGQSSFLGMEVKAENVNDVLRRFGKAAQSVELTPEAVLNRIVQDGKKVPLVQTGWELKRARVNGDYRIELVGPEDRKTLEKLARDGLGTYERIGYVPRFFVPRTAEGLSRFLSEYPAMPEDGGISTVAGSGADYSALDYEQRQSKFTELFNGYQNALSGNGGHAEIVKARDALDGLIAAMPTEELMNIVEEWQQYDTRRAADPVHIMRKMVRIELQKRGAIDDKQITELGLWFNRDIDALTDPLSSVAIHEVNEWRKARGLPEMPKSKRTPVEKIVKAGKYMASNADEMRRFIEVSARTPQNWTAVEVNAVAQRRIALEQDYDEKTRLINVAEMNGNKDEAQRIREARDLVQDQIDLMDSAINKAKREWGLAGLARRFMLNRDGTFARFTGEMRSIVGRELTDEEKQGAWTLWNAYRDAQGKLDEVTVTKTADLLKDIVAKHMAAEEERHRKGDGKSLAEIEREYLYALDHIRVHANRAGGVLVGLPNGRKWLDAIRRYHMARAIETGRKLTVDEMLAAIHEDIDGMVVADDHDIMQMTTGHGNTYEADDSELEKAMREQRRLMNEYQKWEDMMEEGHLPDKTGLIRDEPTQAEREAQRTTREMMREFMQQHPELLAMDASKRLKTIQDSLMKRWQNEIDDLQRAIEDGERIMRQKNTMTYTPEMEAKRRELEQKRQEYREAFPPEPLTHEQKVARIMRALQARLAKLEEKRDALTNAGTDAEREALLSKAKIDKVEDIRLDDLRNQIDEVKEDIEDLKTMHFPEGTPEEFTAMVARRRKALDKNIQRIQILLANRDFAPQKREPSALAKRVAADPEIQALVKTRNAASKRLMEERERFRRSVLPYNAGRVLDWFNVLTSAPRVLRTMLDLSATMTQGAALFTSHPLMGYRALVDSVKAFASEKNTDDIMAAMEADPDYAEFQLMGGHVYTVSDISERGVPEEFRGIATKLVKVNGKEYGLDDIPGVKASERSFGVFLNSINLSVYKAIKASGGWGPTGPTDTQKKDIALSLNVASGRGYENKGARGIWERLASAALWAPRFAISGAKMAIGWNIFAPHWTGLTTERSYKDRMVSSKVAAQQYVRQMASMAAWTLLGTLLMGRKDPEWLEEVLDPRSSNFLNVRVGNTNMNFFGPIKQWWTFMARVLTGQTRGADGMVRKRDRMQTASTFVRGKLSPLAGLGVDLLNQKDFLGNKIVWDKEAGHKEISGWKHVAESLVMPLSSSDLVDAFKENSLANALMLTPFIVAGAGKSTYALDEYARVVSPYKAALKEYKAAMKEGRWADSKQILANNPALKRSASIDNLLKNVAMTKKYIENLEKAGKKPSEDLLSRYERQQQAVMEAIRK